MYGCNVYNKWFVCKCSIISATVISNLKKLDSNSCIGHICICLRSSGSICILIYISVCKSPSKQVIHSCICISIYAICTVSAQCLFLYWFLHLWSWLSIFRVQRQLTLHFYQIVTQHPITTRTPIIHIAQEFRAVRESSFSQGYGLSILDTLVARFVCWHNGSLCQSDLMNDLGAQTPKGGVLWQHILLLLLLSLLWMLLLLLWICPAIFIYLC